jgi:hypothetical protein
MARIEKGGEAFARLRNRVRPGDAEGIEAEAARALGKRLFQPRAGQKSRSA